MQLSSQGRESNVSGQFLENIVATEFQARGIPMFDSEPERRHNGDWVTQCFVVRNVPYVSIYGSSSRSEFLYRDSALGHDIRIECRWQQVPGSVDEKLPFLYMNAVQAMPEPEIWLGDYVEDYPCHDDCRSEATHQRTEGVA